MKQVDEYLSKISPALKEKFKGIKLIVFDFDGVFTDNNVYTDQNGNESIISSKFDGFGLKKLKDLGIGLFILSTEKNRVVEKRANKLEIGFLQNLSSDEKAIELNGVVPKKTRTINHNTVYTNTLGLLIKLYNILNII